MSRSREHNQEVVRFVVVGRVNKGKSTLVATLSEDDDIDIHPTPGTTTSSKSYQMKFQSRVLCEFVDTPGFEQAKEMLEILRSRSQDASDRLDTLHWFLEHKAYDDQFREEKELLKGIFSSKILVYLVDASHPFRSNYEDELEIIRWCSRPSMGVMNYIGSPEYLKDWKRVLSQYFRQVFPLSAANSKPADKAQFFKAAASIATESQERLTEISQLIGLRQVFKIETSVEYIFSFLQKICQTKITEKADLSSSLESSTASMRQAFQTKLVEIEQDARSEIAVDLGFKRLQVEALGLGDLMESDSLFSEQTWQILGLTKGQLAARAAALGATAGALVDLKLLGMTHMAGSLIGGVTAGSLSLLAANMRPEAKFAGVHWSGEQKIIRVDPKSNLIWVLFDRMFCYVEALLLRAHGKQGVLQLTKEKAISLQLTRDQQNLMSQYFARCFKGKVSLEKDQVSFQMMLEIMKSRVMD